MRTEANKELRWIARIFSGLLIALSLTTIIIYRFFPEMAGMPPGKPEPLETSVILELSVGGLVLLGLGLAWKWELFGAIIALVAFIALAIINPTVLDYPLLYIFPASSVLFILLWAKNRDMF